MAYWIAEPCVDVKDLACVEVCPVDCIHPTDGEGVPLIFIDPDECIDCGACEPECPVEAIFAEEDLPEEWNGYAEINTEFFKIDREDPAAVKAFLEKMLAANNFEGEAADKVKKFIEEEL